MWSDTVEHFVSSLGSLPNSCPAASVGIIPGAKALTLIFLSLNSFVHVWMNDFIADLAAIYKLNLGKPNEVVTDVFKINVDPSSIIGRHACAK